MGMHVTPLIQPQPELRTSNLIVDSDIDTDGYNIDTNNLTVENILTAKWIKLLNDKITISPSDTEYLEFEEEINTYPILNEVPFYEYTGSIRLTQLALGGTKIRVFTWVRNSSSSTETLLDVPYGTSVDFTIPAGTVALSVRTVHGGINHIKVGWISNYPQP